MGTRGHLGGSPRRRSRHSCSSTPPGRTSSSSRRSGRARARSR
jgi:hypothetical protein